MPEQSQLLQQRASGILLHISSLPSTCGIGDLGPAAYRFIDFLHDAKQRYWQILPINPTELGYGNSPYSSPSAFAGNFLFISPEILKEQGLLNKDSLDKSSSIETVDYEKVVSYKKKIFKKAFNTFQKNASNIISSHSKISLKQEFDQFCEENAAWLKDYALFQVIHEKYRGKVWNRWPLELKNREKGALEAFQAKYDDEYQFECFLQYLFFSQWLQLKSYAYQKGVHFIGDVPIYVNFDSADVWKNPQYFKLNENKKPYVVAGVPPDYFSKTGQRWGNPVYNWEQLKNSRYDWWIDRLRMNFKLFDVVRIDHFRGFIQYWEIPSREKTAIHGQWQNVPTHDFFNTLKTQFLALPIIAEDLGIITPDVREAMRHFNFPGMKVLMFAFGDDLQNNPYLPQNYEHHCVVYTGTHDNNTVKGWFQKEALPKEKDNLKLYLGHDISADKVHWEFVQLAMKSQANISLIPMQDFLGLDYKSRMNKPATRKRNWQWRLLPDAITPELINQIASLMKETQRIT